VPTAVELDLWLSQDGKLIVFHDADTERLSQSRARSLASRWRKHGRLTWAHGGARSSRRTHPDARIDSRYDAQRAAHRAEIKDGPADCPRVHACAARFRRFREATRGHSFKYDSLLASKKDWPNVEHYFLMDYKKDAKSRTFPELKPLDCSGQERRIRRAEPPFNWPLTKEFATEVKASGLKLCCLDRG